MSIIIVDFEYPSKQPCLFQSPYEIYYVFLYIRKRYLVSIFSLEYKSTHSKIVHL